MIYKSELRLAIGNVSRDLMAKRIGDFIHEKYRDDAYQEVWNRYCRKPYLPEKFVTDFLYHIYKDVKIKINITS
jgi:hypothetical protein